MRRSVSIVIAVEVMFCVLFGFSLPAEAAPVISTLSQGSGVTGTQVTLTGTGFGTMQGTSTVKFGDWMGAVSPVNAQIISWSSGSIVAVVPTFSTGISYFQVVVSGSSSNKAQFSVTNPLTYSLMPSQAAVGASVTIWGTNLGSTQGASTVAFGSKSAQITSWSPYSIIAVVPSGVSGNASVKVTVAGIASNTQTFAVSSNPFISLLSTNSAPVGEEITINGSNFGSSQGSSTISFNGTAAIATTWSPTVITAAVPTGATTGNVVVTVNSVTSNGVAFMVPPLLQTPGVGFVQGNYSLIPQISSPNAQCYQDSSGFLDSYFEFAFPQEQTAGDLNVVIISWHDTNADLQVVGDSLNNQYTLVAGSSQSGNGQQKIWFAPNILSGENIMEVVLSSTHGCVAAPEVRIAEYRGLSTASGFGAMDVSASKNSSGSTSCDSGFATTTNQNDVLIGANLANKPTSAAGANYNSRLFLTPSGDLLEDQVVTAIGSYDASATLSASGNCLTQMIAFKEATNQAPVADAGPNQTITLPTNTVTLSGTVTDDGLPNNTLTISWTKVSGPGTVTFSNPSSTTTQATFSAAGVYVLQLSGSDSELSGTSNLTVTVNAVTSTVVLGPTMAGPDVVGAGQMMTATVTSGGAPLSGASVQFTVTGANTASGNATTNASGIATFTYTGANQGTDSVQATSNGAASNTASVSWIVPIQNVSTTSALGRFYTEDSSACGTGIFDTLPSAVPVFTQEFPTIDFNPPAGTIPGNTSNVNVNTRPFTDITTDQNGNFTGTIVAQGNGMQAGVGVLGCFQAVFTGSFTIKSAGNVSINLFSDDGFILGINGGATHVSGAMVNVPTGGVTPFQQYTVVGSYNQGTAPVGNVEVINFPAPGTYQYELDYTECCSGQLVLTMAVGATNSTGAAPTGALSITPTNPASILTGQVETLTVQATDGSGAPVANLGIAGIIGGANPQFLTATTNSAGQAKLQYVGNNGGTDTVQAVANITNMSTFSNTVSVPWTLASGGGGTNQQGWLTIPNTTVQGIEPISLISGITLASGTLEYWPLSNQTAVTVLNANTTGSGQIGSFDGTILPSGGYVIQLNATTTAGVSSVSLLPVVVTGQLKPGRVVESVTDLKVPLAGIPINITRTYDSLGRFTTGDFGDGWSLATNVNLTIDAFNNVTFTFNQENVTFNFAPQSSSIFFPWLLSPVYVPAPGNHGTLTSNGCNQLIQVQSQVVCFPSTTPYQPTVFTYTDPAGRAYTMAASGQLQRIKDLKGNTLTFASTGISSSVGGLVIPFVRDSQNRITQITDLNGNQYIYSYDSPCGSGNLCSVTFPGIATPATYTYTPDHNIATQVDPNGNTTASTYYVTNDYKNGRLESVTGPTVTGANGSPTQYVTQYNYNLCFGCGILPTNDIQTTVTNPDGGAVTTNYDTFGKPLNITDGMGDVTTYVYDANENAISIADPMNAVTKYTYDSNGFVTSVTDPLLHQATQTSNQFGEFLTRTDATNTNTLTATYDANFNLLQITDLENGPNSQVVSRTYDSQGDVLTNTDANGKTAQYQYDPKGNIIQVTDPLNEVVHISYDPMDRVISQTDPRGNTTQLTYDALGNLKTKTDPLKNVTSYTYDGNGNKTSETDALQRTTNYQYDNLNRLIQITYPTTPATTRQFIYDFRNNKISETDQSGHVTKHSYDLAGRLTSTTYASGTPDAATVFYGYDRDGRETSDQDERGNKTTFTYDAAGRLTNVQDATTNPPTNYGYDADNRRTSVQDPNGNTISYGYYPRSWLKTITYPATSTQPATTTQYAYDGMGRVLTTTDQAGNVVTDGYDAVGRLTLVMDPLTKSTLYSYDLSSNLQSQQDADGRITTYQYDPLNRMATRILPLNSLAEISTYDPVGNLASKRDFNAKTTTYSYDGVNRLLQRIPDSSLNQPTITFTYTPTGKRASMADASGTTSYTSYDNRDRLKTKVTPEGTLNYTYDAHGNVLTIASSNANGASATYTYDVLNRVATVKDNRLAAQGGSSTPTSYIYDPASNLVGSAYPNAMQIGNGFDTLNRLTQTCVATSTPACSASQPLASFAYTWGPAGNRNGVTEATGRAVSYAYDADFRLKSETITGDPKGNNGSETYTYDAVGNRLTLNSTIPSLPGSMTYAYNANDELSTDTYDNNGNTLISLGVTSTYDFENRMLTHGGVSNIYDGDGNRVSETSGAVTTQYLVDTLNPTGYAQVMDELVNGSVTRTYAYGLSRISEDQLVGSTWTPSFYGNDGHSNVRFLASSAANITDTYQFDAFGVQIATTGATPNPYLYSGERFDSNLNLYHLRARYYNTLTGRFETMDSYPGNVFEPATLHKYIYTRGNPVNRLDPSGQADVEEYDELLAETFETFHREKGLLHATEFGQCINGLLAGIAAVQGGTAPGSPDVANSYFECLIDAERGLIAWP